MKEIFTGGCHDCGGRCPYKLLVENGKVTKIEPDDELRACVRGYAYRQRVYSQDRLKFPMRRVGERGEGKFERISWDEALDTLAEELKRVKGTYGPSAILFLGYSGSPGQIHGPATVERLLNLFGGCVSTWGGASAEGSVFANRATFGTLATGNTRDDLVNSRLIIMWGWNPLVTIFSTNTGYQLVKAKEAGAKIVCVDPRFTESAAVLADQWIPIRPGTDAAMMTAMAYVMIKSNLHDRKFLDTYTVGFDEFKKYVLGEEDGISKTPNWAEDITGVSASIIESLAKEYATAKPAALIPSYAPGRTAYGEQFHRAAATLAAMTGNTGISGGNAAGFERAPVGVMFGPGLPTGKNPVESSAPSFRGSLDTATRNRYRLHTGKLWDAIIHGEAGGYPYDIKTLYILCANPLNQFLNTNKGIEALQKLESIIVHEQFMTPTAKFADILLPVNTHWERDDFMRPWLSGAYYLCINKAIESLYESKSDFEICLELAPRLGIHNYSDKTVEEWRKDVIQSAPDTAKDIVNYEEFKKEGIWRIPLDKPIIAFERQIREPENNPFPTPSRKIEIFCQRLADLNNPKIPPIPKYLETWESHRDSLAKKYPLQLITYHYKNRAHSCFDNVPWLKELEPQRAWINSKDAEARGIEDGDEIRVFNDRGEVIILGKVTERIMPGVVAIGEGAWYNPDDKGRDRGGNPNVLTRDEYSPGGAWPTNTCLIQVEKLRS